MIEDMEVHRGEHDEERRRERLDLADVLGTEAGYRVWGRLVRELGGTGAIAATTESVVMKNMAEQMLDDMAHASPAAYLRLCAELRGVPLAARGGEDGRD